MIYNFQCIRVISSVSFVKPFLKVMVEDIKWSYSKLTMLRPVKYFEDFFSISIR